MFHTLDETQDPENEGDDEDTQLKDLLYREEVVETEVPATPAQPNGNFVPSEEVKPKTPTPFEEKPPTPTLSPPQQQQSIANKTASIDAETIIKELEVEANKDPEESTPSIVEPVQPSIEATSASLPVEVEVPQPEVPVVVESPAGKPEAPAVELEIQAPDVSSVAVAEPEVSTPQPENLSSEPEFSAEAKPETDAAELEVSASEPAISVVVDDSPSSSPATESHAVEPESQTQPEGLSTETPAVEVVSIPTPEEQEHAPETPSLEVSHETPKTPEAISIEAPAVEVVSVSAPAEQELEPENPSPEVSHETPKTPEAISIEAPAVEVVSVSAPAEQEVEPETPSPEVSHETPKTPEAISIEAPAVEVVSVSAPAEQEPEPETPSPAAEVSHEAPKTPEAISVELPESQSPDVEESPVLVTTQEVISLSEEKSGSSTIEVTIVETSVETKITTPASEVEPKASEAKQPDENNARQGEISEATPEIPNAPEDAASPKTVESPVAAVAVDTNVTAVDKTDSVAVVKTAEVEDLDIPSLDTGNSSLMDDITMELAASSP